MLRCADDNHSFTHTKRIADRTNDITMKPRDCDYLNKGWNIQIHCHWRLDRGRQVHHVIASFWSNAMRTTTATDSKSIQNTFAKYKIQKFVQIKCIWNGSRYSYAHHFIYTCLLKLTFYHKNDRCSKINFWSFEARTHTKFLHAKPKHHRRRAHIFLYST